MKIFTKGRYALRFVVDLAMNCERGLITLKEVSERQDISIKYLEQIVSELGKANIIKSVRGPQGGHRLARPAKELMAGDVLRAVEGSLAPVACLEDSINQCQRVNKCVTLDFWSGFHNAIVNYVDNISVQDIADDYINKGITDYNI